MAQDASGVRYSHFMPAVRDPGELGARIAEAREAAGLTQAILAERLGIDRTSVVRLEAGSRKVSAGELAGIAETLGRPIDWFVFESPAAVLSRRRDLADGHSTTLALDVETDRAARDVQFLLDRGILTWPASQPSAVPGSHEEAERLASTMRTNLGLSDEPLLDLGALAERLGVVTYSLALDGADDGGCIELTGVDEQRIGVAVINGSQDPGRRRWTLAHELGHFLVGDAYAADHPAGEIEKYLHSFAAYLLMPRTGVQKVFRETSGRGERTVALTLSARYQTSWTAACGQLRNLGLLSYASFERLVSDLPTRGDYLTLGEDWTEELQAPFVPPTYTKQVLTAYVDGELTPERTVELLRNSLGMSDLPSPKPPSLEELRSALDPLP